MTVLSVQTGKRSEMLPPERIKSFIDYKDGKTVPLPESLDEWGLIALSRARKRKQKI